MAKDSESIGTDMFSMAIESRAPIVGVFGQNVGWGDERDPILELALSKAGRSGNSRARYVEQPQQKMEASVILPNMRVRLPRGMHSVHPVTDRTPDGRIFRDLASWLGVMLSVAPSAEASKRLDCRWLRVDCRGSVDSPPESATIYPPVRV